MKILIVDDDFVARRMLQHILLEYGAVDIANDGRQAIEAIDLAFEERDPYDLVCLDILMPEVDGQACLLALRRIESESGIPVGHGSRVLMTTALGDAENVVTAFRNQADGYLCKPFRADQVVAEVRRLFDEGSVYGAEVTS